MAIGKPPTPPAKIAVPGHQIAQDGQDGRTGQNFRPKDEEGLNRLFVQLDEERRTNNIKAVRVVNFRGKVEFRFTLRDGSKYPRRPSRVDRAVAWMRETRRLDRDEFFAANAWARRSCSLHHAAIQRLKATGEVISEGRLNVWRD